jgi:hypothetical protein
MNALADNNRRLVTATVIMLVVAAVLVTLGMILFPMDAFSDPSAGPGSLINTPQGNLIVISLFGLLAINLGVFLNTVTKLERERAQALEDSAATLTSKQVAPPSAPKAIERGK